ncbi:MAG TPA: DJ-1/PfpI family protein [Polyangiaceae bacterium]|nr:DJ-1/PfpI family protein [Polyangiaceae bacterium]
MSAIEQAKVTVGIYVFDEVEVLDFAGPFEVFSTATRVSRRLRPELPPPFSVTLIADRPRTVSARGGLPVVASAAFAQHPPLDLFLVPGGEVSQELKRDDVRDFIARTAGNTALTASVCTGAFLLARAGLLDGRRVTTHWEDIEDLRRMFPALTVQADRAWIDAGSIVTSAGISAGLDMSLYLVSRLASLDLAERTARQMDYDWRRRELDAPPTPLA